MVFDPSVHAKSCDLTVGAATCAQTVVYTGHQWRAEAENVGLERTGPSNRGGKRGIGKQKTFKKMDSVTNHKCSNNVERESKAMAKKHRYQKLRS